MPLGNIVSDSKRYKQIIKGHIKKKDNLKKYISREDLIGKQGKEKIRISVPVINIPRFKFGSQDVGGLGQGEGEIGDPLFGSEESNGKEGSDGQDSGDLMNTEMTMSELEEIIFEELGLPYLEPKGEQTAHAKKPTYKSIAEQGVKKHFKRSYKEALKRLAASGGYKPGDAVIPITRDFRYKAASYQPELQSNAVLIYMLDVSGSMGTSERRLCRLTNSWLQRIIGRFYHNLEEKFIVHTTDAYEVEGQVFYGTTLSGGTHSSSAFQKSAEIIGKAYPPDNWNIYCFYYSDGGNFRDDNDKAFALLGNQLLPAINLFCYGECSDQDDLFKKEMENKFNLNSSSGSAVPKKKIRTASLTSDEDILETLRTFLTKGGLPFYQT